MTHRRFSAGIHDAHLFQRLRQNVWPVWNWVLDHGRVFYHACAINDRSSLLSRIFRALEDP